MHLSTVHLHPFLIGRSQTDTQSQRSRHRLHTSLPSDRKTTLQCKLCLTKEWYEGRPVASPSCSPTWSLPERATHNHLLPGPPRLPRKGLTTKRLGRLITVTVFIVKLTESRIARETGLWMSCEHCYAICLGKTHFNGEREHPLARGPGLCLLEERTQPAFLSLCFLTAVT